MNNRPYDKPNSIGRPFADTPSMNGQLEKVSNETAILLIDDNPAIARA